MAKLAIIGGTGLTSLTNLKITHREVVHTPYGEPSGPLIYGVLQEKEVVFLPRHGSGHTIPPHKINYRANLWALENTGVENIIAVAAVGGIHPALGPAMLAIPDQLIDYTWSRKNTFFEEDLTHVTHIDFTQPYSAALRQLLLEACQTSGLSVVSQGVYAATQGPRLETAAEINRLERDGCTMVGMTGMPEAALARELNMRYATLAVVANWAAGRGGESEISMEEIERCLHEGMGKVRLVLEQVMRLI
ncbi:MAG: 5'-methylthioadenosine phosphorylase [Halothiobacillaceae bacterium]|nr:MAG: 5'-methylthioadenosine phosphorylase [Halothiobacillaceae bacterium]